MIEQALRGLLIGDSEISSLVSSKVYPLVMPQGTAYPAIVYQVVSKTPQAECRGEADTTRLEEARVQLSVFAEKYEQVVLIDEAIREAIDLYTGSAAGHDIKRIRFVTSRDLYEQNALVYHRAIDYRIIYT